MTADEALALLSPEARAAADAWDPGVVPAHILDVLAPVLHAIQDRAAAEAAAATSEAA